MKIILLFAFFLTSSFISAQSSSDKIPYCKAIFADTMTVFNPETFTETITITRDTITYIELDEISEKSELYKNLLLKIDHVVITDTTAIFNPSTFEDKVKVQFRNITLQEYLRRKR